ncbi:MAG: hypothetical protein J6W80_06225, partial [Kiritimatiellae bacterium]|nr:hypothetical protein [Kiritimatiellia bacterium]
LGSGASFVWSVIALFLMSGAVMDGDMQRAHALMQNGVIAKHEALPSVASCPSGSLIVLSVILIAGSLLAAHVFDRRGEKTTAREAILYGCGVGVAAMFLSFTLFTGKAEWTGVSASVAPLVAPWKYALVAMFVMGSSGAAAYAALQDEEKKISDMELVKPLAIAAACALAAILVAASVPEASLQGYSGPKYPWTKSTLVFAVLLVAMFAMAWFTKRGLCFAIPVAGLHIAAFVLLKHGAMNGLTHPASWWFCWPIAWNFILLALMPLTLPHGRSVAGAAFFAQLGVSFYVYMPIVSDLRNPPMNWGYPRTWEGFKHAIQRGQYEAIGFPSFTGVGDFLKFFFRQMWHYFGDVRLQFTDILIPFLAVPFAAAKWVVRKTERKIFWQWMGAAASCFLMMSFLLILLAQVKGDVQDGFIQKVKFISSHAMIALWIGYGLVFAGALIPSRYRRIYSGAVLFVALVFPVVQNYPDERMVFELGGCEQNGHTFGWQFGAYQLDGAKAINAQIVADEEPLPDPDWPEPMEPFSIFFGGTDPGRFVPTYMIYSADFRRDVYLITQNALADDTYMSVQRDLYGDEIWIPSKEDSGEAFNIYIDEVQRGVREANGDLKIENGRVQVTGALGVMEINGILTRMMFDHDRLRHSFYVEESYVIPWMYPYLSPHGLIMKINADPTPYDAKTAAKDRDFWDWYTRRLLSDPMYRRDFAGQKSFSKLRAAIAGLYARQGRRADAAQAYREAVLLYPASPEAVFRYAQEMLMPYRKFAIVRELMDYTDAIDPNNKRTERLRELATRLERVTGECDMLEAKRRKAPLTRQENYILAMNYFSIGRTMEAAQLVRGYIGSATDENELRTLAEIVFAAGLNADAETAYSKYVKLAPNKNADAWVNLCRAQYRLGKKQAAAASIRMAMQIDRNAVSLKMQRDQELYDAAQPLFQQRRR